MRALNFQIGVADSAHSHNEFQPTLLEYLRDLRRVRSANVQGLKPEAVNEDTSLLMETLVTIDEVICRASTYQQRAEQAFASGNTSRSASIYLYGIHYIDNVPQCIKNFGEADSSEITRFSDKTWEISFGFAISEVRNRSFKKGIYLLDQALDNAIGRQDREKAVGFYYKGMAFKELGKYVRAATAFSNALELDPEATEAKQELDALGEMADQAKYTEEEDVRWELLQLREELRDLRLGKELKKAQLESG